MATNRAGRDQSDAGAPEVATGGGRRAHDGPATRERLKARATVRRELEAVLRLAGPLAAAQLGQVGMNTVDTIMVGPLGPHSLAAAGVGSALYLILILVCNGTIMGMTPIVSQAHGRGDLDECDRALVQGIWLAVLLSIPVAGLSWAGDVMIGSLGQDPVVAELAVGYLKALAFSVTPLFMFVAFRQYLEGRGIARPSIVITLLGLGLNIVANRVLIYGVGDWIPAMGVVGSGVATALVRWAMLGMMLAYLGRHTLRRLVGAVRPWPDGAALRRILHIGLPIGGQFGLEVGIFSLAAVMVGWIGPVELAAHQIVINIATVTFMAALGVSMAGSIRVGHHIGARNPRRMRLAVLLTYSMAVGFMALCGVVFLAVPERLVSIYSRDPGITAVGTKLLLFAAMFQIFDGTQVAGVSVLRGAADTRIPMTVCAIGYWAIGLPVAYGLAFRADYGVEGLWAGLTIGLAAVAVLLSIRVCRVLWRGSPAGVEALVAKPGPAAPAKGPEPASTSKGARREA